MKKFISFAIIQPQLSWENIDANLLFFEEQINMITNKVDLVILPETFSTGFTMNVEAFADTEQKTVQWMSRIAKKVGIILAGSCIVKEELKYYNRLYWVDPSGIIKYYDKRHLFRMGREHDHFTRGERRVIVDIGPFRILLQICYDLRFPVFARNRGDYDAILYVANWPSSRKNVWETLLTARAIENQSFVIGANCTGIDGEGVENCGMSCLIDPKGQTIARLNDQPGLLFSSINIDDVISFRKSFPALEDADSFELQ